MGHYRGGIARNRTKHGSSLKWGDMNDDLLLVGSIPFDSAEEVFRTVAAQLGGNLSRLPDGEVMDRRYWIVRMDYQVFNGHPDLDLVHRPAPVDGIERLIPAGLDDYWSFRLKEDRKRMTFDIPGWRLGYAKDAVNSYSIFSALRREGVIAEGTRFQVSLPSVNSVCNTRAFGTDLGSLEIIRSGFQDVLVAEVQNLVDRIPAQDLAIQYDCSWEITDAYGSAGLSGDGIERNVGQFEMLTAVLPSDVQLGLHLCFGTFGGWPRFSPPDLGQAVKFANRISEVARRPFTWMHIPTLDTTQDAFYEPLSALRVGSARIYLGAIHSMESLERRLIVAKRYLPDFGLAGYCGFGRLSRAEADRFLTDHVSAIVIASRINGRAPLAGC